MNDVNAMHAMNDRIAMPEIRTNLSEKEHRSLKAEAARRGMALKDLVANIVNKFLAEIHGKDTKNQPKQ